MARQVELRPINDIIARVKEEGETSLKRCVERIRKETEDTIARIERNRQVLADLDAAGIELHLYEWMRGDSVSIDLGFFPSTKKGNRELASKLRAIRDILGCRLGEPAKDLANARKRHVGFTYHPEAFPGIRVTFQRKLPPTPKRSLTNGKPQPRCRIVTQRSTYKTLVCDL